MIVWIERGKKGKESWKHLSFLQMKDCSFPPKIKHFIPLSFEYNLQMNNVISLNHKPARLFFAILDQDYIQLCFPLQSL